MSTRLNTLILAAFAVSTLGGCIVERQTVRDEPQAALPAPPPPPSDEVDALPPAPQAAAPEPGAEVDEQVFVERLSPYGHWDFVPDYGQVWVPAVATGWRPYWYGHWVLTEWGWTFVSEDPWGWATYHYGRWGFTAGTGWFWVPGRVWGPAWVSWRYGDGYCAWSPLGPRGYVYGYSSPAWVAVRQEHFTQPIVRYGVVGARQTAPIVQRAQALPAPRSRPVPGAHFGPPVASVAAASGQPLHPVRAAAVVPRPAPVAAPRTSAGRPGGVARSAPVEAAPRSRPSAPVEAAPRSRSSAPSSPGAPSTAPSRGESGSSGRAQPHASPPPAAAPHAAPAHGPSTYRMEPSGPARYGGGPAPKASPGRASAARRGGNHGR
ncbi:MAG: DUF6600 domain-containing protein [Myxococcales bacterium]